MDREQAEMQKVHGWNGEFKMKMENWSLKGKLMANNENDSGYFPWNLCYTDQPSDPFLVRNSPKGKCQENSLVKTSYIQNMVCFLTARLPWCMRAQTPGGLLVQEYPIRHHWVWGSRKCVVFSPVSKCATGGTKFHTLRELFFSIISEKNLKF